jgi:hypothetical protein
MAVALPMLALLELRTRANPGLASEQRFVSRMAKLMMDAFFHRA